MSKKKKIKLDEFHYHEALDRTHMLLCMVDEHLLEHPVVQNHKQLKIRVEIVGEILAEIYERVGALDFKKFEGKHVPDAK